MTQTLKNWFTTFLGAGLTGVVTFLATGGFSIPSTDTWSAWRPTILAAVFAFVVGVYHAYQPQSGKKGPDGSSGSGGGGGGSSKPAPANSYRWMPLSKMRPAYFTIAFKNLVRQTTIAFTAGGLLVAMWLLAGLALGANCNGTIDPKTQAEIQAALVLGDCIETQYAIDSQKTPPVAPLQIAIDIGAACGADVPVLVNTFSAQTDAGHLAVVKAAQANAGAVHAASSKRSQ